MALTDDDLVAVDEARMPNFDDAKARRDLEEHGDAFRHQLVVARHLDLWADLAEGTKRSPTTDISWVDGRVKTLREVADQLRAGEYVPGGRPYDETIAG